MGDIIYPRRSDPRSGFYTRPTDEQIKKDPRAQKIADSSLSDAQKLAAIEKLRLKMTNENRANLGQGSVSSDSYSPSPLLSEGENNVQRKMAELKRAMDASLEGQGGNPKPPLKRGTGISPKGQTILDGLSWREPEGSFSVPLDDGSRRGVRYIKHNGELFVKYADDDPSTGYSKLSKTREGWGYVDDVPNTWYPAKTNNTGRPNTITGMTQKLSK